MSARSEAQDRVRALACRPGDTTDVVPYCACGRYFRDEADWRSQQCAPCRTGVVERRGGKR